MKHILPVKWGIKVSEMVGDEGFEPPTYCV
jgi:hypothetical protein